MRILRMFKQDECKNSLFSLSFDVPAFNGNDEKKTVTNFKSILELEKYIAYRLKGLFLRFIRKH